ncbi:MAG: carboxypeptidase-like regulatory domain-containing protein [Planctomycetes bacterium]|nr:carboxypeptidase-like regulatory domain-containing protein [Planctomycetota bacterium]
MKRLLVIAGFVVVVLGALAGGAYLVMSTETAPPRKPVVAKQAEDEPAPAANSSRGPLSNPDQQDANTPSDDTPPPDDKPDKPVTPPADTTKPVKPAPPKPDTTPPSDETTKPVKPDGVDQPDASADVNPTGGEATFAGRATDDQGGAIAGATITLSYLVPQKPTERRSRGQSSRSASNIATTDDDGFYRVTFKLIFPGPDAAVSVTLSAQLGESQVSPDIHNLEVSPNGLHENLDFVIPRGSTITGRVVNHRFEPLPGATVVVQPMIEGGGRSKGIQFKADDSGTFTATGLKPGTYGLLGIFEGYQPGDDVVIVDLGSGETHVLAQDVRMKPQTGIVLRLTALEGQPTGRFNVTYYNAEGKSTRASATADAEGNALLGGVPEDAIELEIEARGYEKTARMSITVAKDDHTDIGEIALTPTPGG